RGGVAAHIGKDDIEGRRKRGDVEMAFVVEAGPTVDEEEWRARTLTDIVIAQAVDGSVLVREAVVVGGHGPESFGVREVYRQRQKTGNRQCGSGKLAGQT